MGDYTLEKGQDNLLGTDENDTFTIGRTINTLLPTDVIAGGGGTDTLRFPTISELPPGSLYPFANIGLSPERLAGLSSIERIDLSVATAGAAVLIDAKTIGQADGDQLTLAFGANPLTLGVTSMDAGAKVVLEGSGAVTLLRYDNQKIWIADGFNGNVTGNRGVDTLTGGSGNDRLSGGDNADVLSGGAGDDVLDGGTGIDLIDTGGGTDIATGGTEADIFRVGSGSTTITDFDVDYRLERIDLRQISSAKDFSNLTISDTDAGALVKVADTSILLNGVQSADLRAGNFIFNGQPDPTVVTVSAGTSQAVIQRLIKEAPAGTTIQLEAGEYEFTSTLTIGRSDIKLIGAGSDKTIIRSNIPDADAAPTIKVVESQDNNRFADVSVTAAKGSNTIQLSTTAGVKAGDILYISQPNDDKFFAETGNTGIITKTEDNEDSPPLRESLTKVVAVNGNTVTLAEPLPFTFEANKGWAGKPDLLRNVEVGGFSIETPYAPVSSTLFENTRDAWSGITTVALIGLTDSKIYDIQTHNNASKAFSFVHSYGITADHLTAIGTQNKGAGGNGYAWVLTEVFSSRFTHLTDQDMRHSVLFSPWHAEHYNYIQVDSTNRDINFHGGPDSGNTIVIDRSVALYDPDGFSWPTVGPGSFPVHPRSTIEDNDVRFRYLRSTDNDETVHAAQTGGDIDTAGGHDVIYGARSADRLSGGDGNDLITGERGNDRLDGGNGADVLKGGANDDTLLGGNGADVLDGEAGIDVLDGGTGNDTIKLGAGDTGTGGAGSDTFVITGNATITDFAVADPLEKIDLRALKAAKDFAALTLSQSGSDARVVVGGVTLTLKNVKASSLTAEDFVFFGDRSLTIAERHAMQRDVLVTTGTDTYQGTAGADLFEVSSAQFGARSKILGGAGADTLRLVGDPIGVNAEAMGRLSSVETIDVSLAATASVDLHVTAAGVAQADGKRLTIYGGAQNLTLDTGSVGKAGTVVVETYGTVSLARSIDNVVTVSDAVRGKVVGDTGRDTVTGGRQADTLSGGNEDDVLKGGAGDDVLDGGLNDDLLDGGAGKDMLNGGAGDDILRLEGGDFGTGGTGSDTFAITGNATITDFSVVDHMEKIDLRGLKAATGFSALKLTQVGADTHVTVGGVKFVLKNVTASKIEADDFLFVGDTRQTLAELHARAPVAMVTSGADKLVGTAGDDVFEGSGLRFTAADTINGGRGTDTLRLVTGNVGFDDATLAKLTSVEVIDGSMTDGTLTFQVGAAGVGQADGDRLTLFGGMKDMTLDTGSVGKAGTVVVETYGTVSLRKSVDNVVTVSDAVRGKVVGDTGRDTIFGGRLADTLSGDNADDVLYGRAGDDVLDGGFGDDLLDGGPGKDVLNGGEGNDTLRLEGGDFATGGAGSDVFAVTGNATITDFSVLDRMEKIDLRGLKAATGFSALKVIQAGRDTQVAVGGFKVTLKNVDASKIGADDFLYFGQTGQTLAELHAKAPVAMVTSGADKLVGTAGNDVFEGSALRFTAIDSINGGGGTDTLRLVTGNVGLVDTTLAKLTSVEVIDVSQTDGDVYFQVGAAGVGQADGDRLTLLGGMKDMTLNTAGVGKAGTVVVETFGTVFLRKMADNVVTVSDAVEGKVLGNTGHDAITGGRQADFLSGGNGNDVLRGAAGDDVLGGGLQNDTLTGGAGADTFVFDTVPTAVNLDHVTDFATVDTIRLAKSVFTALAPGQLAEAAFKDLGVAGAKLDANDRIVYNHDTGVLAYDADGSGKTAAVTFAVLDNKALLTHADVFVV